MREHSIQNEIREAISKYLFPDEEWRPIVGFEKFYEISNHGRVRYFPRQGNHFRSGILKPVIHRDGYVLVSIVDGVGKRYCKKIHRLVAEAFIPREKEKNVVHHKDSVKTNNYVSNLEWVTISENTWHSSQDGLLSKPRNYSIQKRAHAAQIGKEKCSRPIVQLDQNGNEITRYPSLSEASRILGIKRQDIRGVCTGKYSQWRGTYWRYANA